MAPTQKITTHLRFNGNARDGGRVLHLRIPGFPGHEHRAVGRRWTRAAGDLVHRR
jgi:hypothetical protein